MHSLSRQSIQNSINTDHRINYICVIVILFFCLIFSRGLLNNHLLAGHDATAYPVTLHQFHQNISSGVCFPRWAPDMRYGYGHPKLQFRPPLLQYIAEIFYFICGNFFLSVNLTVAIFIFIAGFGMYAWCRTFLHDCFAMVSACAFISFHYFLADIYIRGAYYEVLAYAFMPWIFWAQSGLFENKIPVKFLITGSLSWTGIWCSHPAVAVFFLPLSFACALYLSFVKGKRSNLSYCIFTSVCGLLIAAPYVYVSFREFNLVRLNLFYTDYRAFSQNFLSITDLFLEKWPMTYMEFRDQVHLEMRGFNWWGIFIFFTAPVTWFLSSFESSNHIRLSQFFFCVILISLFMCLKISLPFWELCSILHTFNFPWRVLTITGFCISVLLGNSLELIRIYFKWSQKTLSCILTLVLLLMLIETAPHTSGWPGVSWMTSSELTSQAIKKHAGIPDQFYTPFWVKQYATTPAESDLKVLKGKAHVSLIKKTPEKWIIQVDAQTPCHIAVSHYYYPGWQISMDSLKPQQPKISPLKGLITFNSPPGLHRFELTFGMTWDRIIGYIFTILGILCLTGMIIYQKRKISS